MNWISTDWVQKQLYKITFNLIWASSRPNLVLLHANNKCTDKPVHPHRLVSTFVIKLFIKILLHVKFQYRRIYSWVDWVWVVPIYWYTHISGLKLTVRNRKIIFLFFNQNLCCGYSKEPSQWDGSFEQPRHMFKLMDKKIIAILRWKSLLKGPYALFTVRPTL